MPVQLDTECRRGWAAWQALAPEWSVLRQQAGLAAFHDPHFLRAFLRDSDQPWLLTVRVAGQLRVVLPLVAERASVLGLKLRRLRGAAPPFVFCFDLVAGAITPEVAAALWQCLAAQAGWDVVEFHNLAAGGLAEAVVAACRRAGSRSVLGPVTPAPLLFLDAPEARSGHFQKNLRRARQQLAALAPLRSDYRRATQADLTAFAGLEAAGWKGRSGSAVAMDPAVWNNFVECAGEYELHQLWSGAQRVAMSLGMTGGPQHEHFYIGKWAYDEAYARYSPGQLLIAAVIEECRSRGVTQLHLEGDADPYKLQWTRRVEMHAVWYLYRPGWKGTVIAAARNRAWSIRLRSPWR